MNKTIFEKKLVEQAQKKVGNRRKESAIFMKVKNLNIEYLPDIIINLRASKEQL